MQSAGSLTDKMDALADALRAAGVPPERRARILGSAAEATMHALVLDAVLEEQIARPAATATAPAPAHDEALVVADPAVRLAA